MIKVDSSRRSDLAETNLMPFSRKSPQTIQDCGENSRLDNSPEGVSGCGAGGSADAPEDETRDDTGSRASDHPASADDRDHFPVDSAHVAVAEPDAHCSTGDAVSRRDGDAELGEDEDGEHGANVHAEATRRCLVGELVSEAHHDLVTHEDEAEVQTDSAVEKHTKIDVRLFVDGARDVDSVDG